MRPRGAGCSLLLTALGFLDAGGAGAYPLARSASHEGPAVVEIAVGTRFETELAPGQVLEVQAPLLPGDYLVEIDQQGIDTIVSAWVPGFFGAVQIDSPQDEWGIESLLVSPGQAGVLRLEIATVKPAGDPGTMSLRILPLPPEEAEPARVRAEAARTRAGASYAAGGPDRYDEAATEYLASAAYWQRVGNDREAARDLFCAASIFRLIGRPQAALDLNRRLLPILRSLGDASREADLLNEAGLIRLDQGELDEAQRLFEAVRELRQRLPGHLKRTEAQSNLCLIHFYRAELEEGLGCYETLLGRSWYADGSTVAAAIHMNMGRARAVLGEPASSLEHYSRALAIWRRYEDEAGVAQTLNNLAVTHSEIGEIDEAIRLHSEALTVFRKLAARRWVALSLHNLGFAYLGLGEADRAVAYVEEAFPLLLEAGDRRTAAASLIVKAKGLLRTGRPGEAREASLQAIETAAAAQDLRRRAVASRTLAEAERRLGELDAALRHAGEAAGLAAGLGDRLALASARALEGAVLLSLGKPAGAAEAARQALDTSRAIDDPAGQVDALITLARAQRAAGDLEEAVETSLAALDVLRSHRARFVLPEHRSAYVASRRQAYDVAIDHLAELAAASGSSRHLETAFAVADEGHAVGLEHAVSSSRPGVSDGPGPSAEGDRHRELTRSLFVLAKQDRERDWTKPDAAAAAATSRRQRNHLLNELELLERQGGRASLYEGASERTDRAELQRFWEELPEDTILLSYWLGPRRGHLWLVDSSGIRHVDLPPHDRIEAAVREALAELSRGSRDRQLEESLRRVGELAAAPIRAETRVGRLLVIPDGPLHRLPFSALVADARLDEAAAEPAIVRLPSISVLLGLRRRSADSPASSRWAAVIADPLFEATDGRISVPSLPPGPEAPAARASAADEVPWLDGYLPRLRHTTTEAEAVRRASPAPTTLLLGEDASVRNLMRLDLRDYRVLHLATHAAVDDEHPRLSGLVLSRWDRSGRPQDGFLDLATIRRLHLRCDLVVLSACDSGLGKAVTGEGLVGLVQAFLEAGASSILASLWAVDDEATAALMSIFYDQLREGRSAAGALAEARRWMRRSERWSAPHHWAAFILVGDWQVLRAEGVAALPGHETSRASR